MKTNPLHTIWDMFQALFFKEEDRPLATLELHYRINFNRAYLTKDNTTVLVDEANRDVKVFMRSGIPIPAEHYDVYLLAPGPSNRYDCGETL